MISRKKRPKTRYAPRLKHSRVNRVHCRLPERLHSDLTLAADGNRWTLSAEVVHRLEQSFATPATPTQAFFAIVAHAIDGLRLLPPLPPSKNDQQREQEWRKLAKSTWLTDPYLYREAKHAVERALELVAPAKDLPVGAEHPALVVPSGRHGLETWLDEVQSCDPKAKVDDSRPRRAQRQRRLAMSAVDLVSWQTNWWFAAGPGRRPSGGDASKNSRSSSRSYSAGWRSFVLRLD